MLQLDVRSLARAEPLMRRLEVSLHRLKQGTYLLIDIVYMITWNDKHTFGGAYLNDRFGFRIEGLGSRV